MPFRSWQLSWRASADSAIGRRRRAPKRWTSAPMVARRGSGDAVAWLAGLFLGPRLRCLVEVAIELAPFVERVSEAVVPSHAARGRLVPAPADRVGGDGATPARDRRGTAL